MLRGKLYSLKDKLGTVEKSEPKPEKKKKDKKEKKKYFSKNKKKKTIIKEVKLEDLKVEKE